MTLSLVAQAVLDATRFEVNAECHAPWIAAATLRAVVVQVVPVSTNARQMKIRDELLAIADELDLNET